MRFVYRLGTLCVRPPRAGFGFVRIDLLHFLAGCYKRQLNQALSFCLYSFCVLFIRVTFVYCYLVSYVFCVLVVLINLSVLAK